METKDLINILAIVLSPVIAVCVTLWYQNRSERIKIKNDVFLILMKNRNSIDLPYEYIQALNSIDAIFHDNEPIKYLWASLYDNYRAKDPDFEQRPRLQIDLLSAIAKHLGYSNLTQMQINKYYTPQLHGDVSARQREISDELLRLLKASENYGTPRNQHDNKTT